MAIYYLKESKIEKDQIIITNDLLHHLKNVLRIKKGEKIKFFDDNFIYTTECIEKEKDALIFRIKEISKNKKPEIEFNIIQSVIEKNELEDSIRLLVTSRVSKIFVTNTERSAKSFKETNLKRLREIALNTSEQSEICFIPEIIYLESLDRAIQMFHENSFVLHFGSKYSLKDIPSIANLNKPITFFVGPEGGFSEGEIEMFKKNAIPIITLKSGVFRSQFAGTVAVLVTLELIS
ncbi:RsmE family RNA methyltransferase [Caldisericum exile]|uniref:RsmE family RNA methyltransferase n=1 Tax=Caldisericum exile TaxID=693075 RepID=UPI003C771946